ncbi:cell division protein FtsA [Patescibacteria group bacterium]|nr:cell division protein FtsA [Patescibacteria group bacterium]MCL5733329.1 cell division protein FtsA [Patescibacteria group bacterium]
MGQDFVVGLDVGTSSIKAVLVEVRRDGLFLRKTFKYPSVGLRKGIVSDLSETVQSLAPVIGEIKKISRSAARKIYLNINSSETRFQTSKGIIAVSRAASEISPDDLDKVQKAAESINLGPNRVILHNVTQEYIVDGVGGISDPLGLNGSRLEIESLIIDAFTPHLKNLAKAVELAGGGVEGVIFAPLAASKSALSQEQKDLGVLLVDVGASTTGISVYEEGKLIKTAIFTIGGNNISNDIAVGFKIPVSVAENLKINFGNALAKEVGQKETIDLQKIYSDAKSSVSRRFLAEIIQSRLEEIFDLVNKEIKTINRAALPGGVILTGGGAKMPGLTELAKQELRLSAQLGSVNPKEWTPNAFIEFPSIAEDSEFITAFGLSMSGNDKDNISNYNVPLQAKKILRYFLP